ncbi:hypothetical protein PtA15_6A540 [Puccinia triticina]|uniref:Uncharacterized protein n=1 Tax=Puccinia triticina TaxID=208348 RepID=A0ABY7CL00_9BASI|nr:uncharacterized protein PtA15_6A540 [Puccinia triticina]WAQ85911.1 hypothetical protein PtA15_6A540 [Puccinia triticina]WAR55805.1 hypothetical protein PtB15_6B548 [Puccinia triticina]
MRLPRPYTASLTPLQDPFRPQAQGTTVASLPELLGGRALRSAQCDRDEALERWNPYPEWQGIPRGACLRDASSFPPGTVKRNAKDVP